MLHAHRSGARNMKKASRFHEAPSSILA